MAIYDLWLSRNNGPTVNNYVGNAGRLFYDSAERVLRISDGITAGGSVMTYPIASSSQIGGVKLGPGVVLNGDGQIIIDSEGLEFSFGDFAATVGTYTDNEEYAVLSSINTNEDIVLASNGTGSINIVGELHVHATNGSLTGTLETEAAFLVKSDGQVRMLVPGIDSVEGAVSIVGSSTGLSITPGNTGVMLHITGQPATPGIPSRLYNDAQNSFAAFVARRFNGTVAAPTAVLADEEIMRISGTAHDGTVIPGAGNTRILYKALGNQTLTNHGGVIELWTTPLNSTTLAKVVTINNADGITSTKFTGPLTGNVTGNASGTAGSVAAANITGTTLAASVVTSSLTTVGTLGSLDVTNLVTAKNYSGQTRNAGTVTAGAGTEITIDFATDHIVRFNYSTEPVQIGFTNYSAGKTVILIAINTNAANRQLEIGIAAANTQGVTTLDVNGNTTAIVTYYCTGATIGDVFASTAYQV